MTNIASVLLELPRLSGNDSRRVAKGLPRVAGEWKTSGLFRDVLYRVYDDTGAYAAFVYPIGHSWGAKVYGDDPRRASHLIADHGNTLQFAMHVCDEWLATVLRVALCSTDETSNIERTD